MHSSFVYAILLQYEKGYFVDEIWSYGLSNSYYHAQLEDNNSLENVKISSELFKNI